MNIGVDPATVGAAIVDAAMTRTPGQSDLEQFTGRVKENEIKSGGIAVDRLRSLVERIEKLEEERKALGSDIKDIFQEAKSAGFDVKVLRRLIRIRKQEAAEVEEQETMLDIYRRALGVLTMEQNTLALTCSAPNARPIKVTPAMARLAAEKVANALVKGPMHGDRMDAGELVDDIMQVWKSKGELDGYKLGTELDRHCSWDCDLDVAEELDTFSSLCRDELSRAETLWGAENPIDPPFPVGTIVKTRHGEGPIEKVHEYGPAKYVVGIGGIHAIINFEDCQAVDVDSDIAAEVAAVEATLGDGR